MNRQTTPNADRTAVRQTSVLAFKYLIGLWLTCGTLAFLLCFYHFSATLVDGVFIPADTDSFYHARRIIAALGHPFQLMQFDPNIHAPEGSWVTWPWAYDTMMTVLGGWLMSLTGIEQPMVVLAFIAPVWVYINAALLIAIGHRLGLRLPLLGVALLGFALSPLTQSLHRVGMLDHHFVELSFVLTAVWLGLRWFAGLDQQQAAGWCAIALGAAPAFHNGLFILQLPLLLTLFVIWANRRAIPRAAADRFGVCLLASTSMFLLPSEAFLDGQFSFSVHSWFHLYIAGSSALVVLAFAYLPRRVVSFAIIGLGAAILAIPILTQIGEGGNFIRGDIITYEDIPETRSVLGAVMNGDLNGLQLRYSGLMWLLPITLVGLVWQLRTHRDNADLFFLVMCGFGVVLLTMQFRLQYFGSFVLYFGWCVVAQRWMDSAPRQALKIGSTVFLIFVLAHVTPLGALDTVRPIGGSFEYMATREIYPVLSKACETEPGVVLADHADGHFISYHTVCAVTANMFILTTQHQRKVMESQALFRSNLDEVLKQAPNLRYIFVRRADNVFDAESCHPQCVENIGLREELLGEGALHSPHVTLLFGMVIQRGNVQEPLARLFAVTARADKQ